MFGISFRLTKKVLFLPVHIALVDKFNAGLLGLVDRKIRGCCSIGRAARKHPKAFEE